MGNIFLQIYEKENGLLGSANILLRLESYGMCCKKQYQVFCLTFNRFSPKKKGKIKTVTNVLNKNSLQ